MASEAVSPSRRSEQDTTSLPARYQCPVCFKRYKRREHLFRHTSSHTSERPYRCDSCDGSFQRADVLKRHLRTCDGGSSRSGGRRRACDRCVRQKKACSAHQPCQNCSKKGVACFYSTSPETEQRPSQAISKSSNGSAGDSVGQNGVSSMLMDPTIEPDTSIQLPWTQQSSGAFGVSPLNNLFSQPFFESASPTWQDYLLLASESQVLRDNPLLDTGRSQSLRFLDRFTSNTGLLLSFDCGTQEQRDSVAAQLEVESRQEIGQSYASTNPTTLGLDSPPLLDNLSDVSTIDCIPINWLCDPLSLKTHEILLLIEEVVTIKPRNSAVTLDWSSALKNASLQFFSPANLRRFLGFYWAIWHPNVNFIHRPSFDPISAKPALVAAMAIIGACVSPDMPDNEDARTWFNCVEEIVFIDDDFNSDAIYSVSNNMAIYRRKVQVLQAAYIVCLYQNWEGTDSSKSRIRRNRFATLVSTARDIGITTATHLNYAEMGRHEFEWKEYATREELIRIFTWIFLLDTAFVIFNNLPPRMVIKEMRMHLATPESCFQALTADECHQEIQTHLPCGSAYWSLSFRGAFEALAKDTFSPSMRQIIAASGPLNLFALTSAIHSQIFQYRSSVSSSQNLTPIRNTLQNWCDSWQLFASTSSNGITPHVTIDDNNIRTQDMWKRVGFCRYCPEFWLLGSLMTERLGVLGDLRQGNDLAPLDDGALDPILNKYDQTSMRQVNNLIVGFQTFQL
ncbi:uncharacterized protein N7473_008349 [Penicillium subrubescens]|uniref:uncharacterized protein n=1 Tax=Penicillium subrubescens TaxID=1316194 RepID=UPI002544D560|nr:uncharacterized protein N7473_008349 [Penicillium subrubescens]KAJ5892121.1 hypothetical protein N7473_008349 [Penicillium subrubescens]